MPVPDPAPGPASGGVCELRPPVCLLPTGRLGWAGLSCWSGVFAQFSETWVLVTRCWVAVVVWGISQGLEGGRVEEELFLWPGAPPCPGTGWEMSWCS